jgi:S1-C subfamily serine protease
MSKIGLSRLAVILLGLSVALLARSPAALAQSPDREKDQASVKLSRAFMDLPTGTEWLSLQTGLNICLYSGITKSWTGGRQAMQIAPYAAAFKTELQAAGFKVVTPGEENLFDSDSASADYEVAAVITDERIEGCIDAEAFTVADAEVRGTGTMKIDWQVYSPAKKQVVARASTSGSAKLDRRTPGGAAKLIMQAFAANVRELAASQQFRSALTAPKVLASNGTLQPVQQSKIALAGSLKAVKRPISDAVGSVVTVFSSLGTGSGDLVSTDGYMLTNAHVVGDEKQVRVRWSDGIETVADVVRVVKTRDVALIKTSSRDREPLAIKRGAVSPGQRVYAIGSPLGKEYQGTVSSGIISATRIIEGLRYIQSDVAISHGSSGGALLDENGAMIGITVSGIEPGVASGLHFFIPIGDALDFLNLEPQ